MTDAHSFVVIDTQIRLSNKCTRLGQLTRSSSERGSIQPARAAEVLL